MLRHSLLLALHAKGTLRKGNTIHAQYGVPRIKDDDSSQRSKEIFWARQLLPVKQEIYIYIYIHNTNELKPVKERNK